MGWHLIKKTGNIAAVQRQLGLTNAAYIPSSTPELLARSWLRRWMIGDLLLNSFKQPYIKPFFSADNLKNPVNLFGS